jgi:hypothetical protein
MTWSNSKSRHLFKILVVITPDQWICGVTGPHAADAKATDGNVLVQLCNTPEFVNFFRPGDIVMVDRGFINTYTLPTGVTTLMPHFLRNTTQFSTKEANENRRVTAFRWPIEVTNERIKEWKELEHMDVKSIPDAMSKVKFVCCVQNMKHEIHFKFSNKVCCVTSAHFLPSIHIPLPLF